MGTAEVDHEIERKYLLSALPAMPPAQRQEIEQGWLPGEQLQERLRRVSMDDETRYLRTVKLGSGLRRIEIEEPTDERVFTVMWPLTEGCRVRKLRYRVSVGDRTWEIDEFLDRELVLAEIELGDVDEPVQIPQWLAPVLVREVTEEGTYTNRRLAR